MASPKQKFPVAADHAPEATTTPSGAIQSRVNRLFVVTFALKYRYTLSLVPNEVTADGTTYHLELEHLKLIREHLQSIAAWYDSLDKITREQIWLTSAMGDYRNVV